MNSAVCLCTAAGTLLIAIGVGQFWVQNLGYDDVHSPTTFAKLSGFYNLLSIHQHPDIPQQLRNSATAFGFPYRVACRGDDVAEFSLPQYPFNLPDSFRFQGQHFDTKQFLTRSSATGLVVLHVNSPTKAVILHEQYFSGNDATSMCMSASLGKAILSALVGCAIREGKINSILDMASDYLPELQLTAFANVTLKNLLQMSTGVKLAGGSDKDYAQHIDELYMLFGWSMDGYMRSFEREHEQGTVRYYLNMNAYILCKLLSKVSGSSLTRFLEDSLWSKVGFEADAQLFLDNDKHRMELVFGLLAARTRDYARLGWLYLNGGRSPLDGSQLLDEDYVKASVTADGPHLQPLAGELADYDDGYGFMWWLPGKQDSPKEVSGEFFALGVFSQFIYCNPARNVVIAVNAAYGDPNRTVLMHRKDEYLALFRTISESIVQN